MKTLIEKYNDPNNPGLVNYLNLHHDVLAVHKFVLAEKDPGQTFVDRNVDMVSLFVSIPGSFFLTTEGLPHVGKPCIIEIFLSVTRNYFG